jgi:hypothetical protein
MREALLGKLVLVLSRATPEKLAAVYQFATGEGLSGGILDAGCSRLDRRRKSGNRASGTTRELRESARMPKNGRLVGAAERGVEGKPTYVFRWTGRDWEVVCGGGRGFHLPNVLGARYLDYHLHRPNQPISAFDLEVAVSPEKGEARARNSIQPESDARALAEYREELGRLQERRKELEAAGDPDALEHLDNEVTALETALTGSDRAADTGKRAFDNVRKAVGTVRKHLRQGGPEEWAFEERLRSQLSLGHECMYSAPEGRVWI